MNETGTDKQATAIRYARAELPNLDISVSIYASGSQTGIVISFKDPHRILSSPPYI